jgi:hypothetical protein
MREIAEFYRSSFETEKEIKKGLKKLLKESIEKEGKSIATIFRLRNQLEKEGKIL